VRMSRLPRTPRIHWTDFTIWTFGSIAILTAKNNRAVNWVALNITKKGFQPFWPNRVIIKQHRILEILARLDEDEMTWREV